jgi:hypothetical protein
MRHSDMVDVAVRVSLLMACGVLATACSSSGSAGDQPARSASPLPSTTHAVGPLAAEACGPVEPTADGNVRPVFCADGHPNAAAIHVYLDTLHASVLRLPRHAAPARIHRAICADERANVTTAEESWAVAIAAAERGWRLGTQPQVFVADTRC